MNAAENVLWTIADVANFLRVSKSMIYKKVESGTMPCIRVGALLRFDPAVVRRWATGEPEPTNVVPMKRG